MRDRLKDFREQLGFTQEEFAKMLTITRQQYSNIEKGKRTGSAMFWLSLQKKFNLTYDEVIEMMLNFKAK